MDAVQSQRVKGHSCWHRRVGVVPGLPVTAQVLTVMRGRERGKRPVGNCATLTAGQPFTAVLAGGSTDGRGRGGEAKTKPNQKRIKLGVGAVIGPKTLKARAPDEETNR